MLGKLNDACMMYRQVEGSAHLIVFLGQLIFVYSAVLLAIVPVCPAWAVAALVIVSIKAGILHGTLFAHRHAAQLPSFGCQMKLCPHRLIKRQLWRGRGNHGHLRASQLTL